MPAKACRLSIDAIQAAAVFILGERGENRLTFFA
jgi:hypothetical protein